LINLEIDFEDWKRDITNFSSQANQARCNHLGKGEGMGVRIYKNKILINKLPKA
jgi:hypothetical protein